MNLTTDDNFQYMMSAVNESFVTNVTISTNGSGNVLCDTDYSADCHLHHDWSGYTEISSWIWKIMPMFLLVVGSVGNVITITVLLRVKLRRVSSTVYLIALAINDLVVLYFGLLRQWIWKTHRVDFRPHLGCGFHIWLVYTSVAYSSWILVALTTERVVSVKFPVYARNGLSRKSAVIVLSVLLVIISGTNLHMIFSWKDSEYILISSTTNTTIPFLMCEFTSDSSYHVMKHIWPWVDLCLVSVVPLILLVLGNCIIGKSLHVRTRSRKISRSKLHQKDNTNSTGHQRSITKLLALLSVVFFVSTLPASVYLVTVSFFDPTESPETVHKYALWWAIASMFMYANNAINFILYCVSGTNFRHELKTMLKELRQFCHERLSQICKSQKETHSLRSFVQGLQASFRQRHNKVDVGSDFGSPGVKSVSSLNRHTHSDASFRDRIYGMFFRDKRRQSTCMANNSKYSTHNNSDARPNSTHSNSDGRAEKLESVRYEDQSEYV